MITSILEIDLTQTVRYYLDHRDPPLIAWILGRDQALQTWRISLFQLGVFIVNIPPRQMTISLWPIDGLS
jgi:hypothetical protein